MAVGFTGTKKRATALSNQPALTSGPSTAVFWVVLLSVDPENVGFAAVAAIAVVVVVAVFGFVVRVAQSSRPLRRPAASCTSRRTRTVW